jgi:hypothetical protein
MRTLWQLPVLVDAIFLWFLCGVGVICDVVVFFNGEKLDEVPHVVA